MKRTLIVRREAEADIDQAFAWYESQRPGLGHDFLLCVEAAMDSSPMWVNGRINPIFSEPLAAISIDPLTNKTIRKDGTPDGLWRPQRKGGPRKTGKTARR